MLYTLSQADYHHAELKLILTNLTPQDVVVLWQNGVLFGLKQPELFASIPCYALENDLLARGINLPFPTLSLAQFVTLTEQYFPHVAL